MVHPELTPTNVHLSPNCVGSGPVGYDRSRSFFLPLSITWRGTGGAKHLSLAMRHAMNEA